MKLLKRFSMTTALFLTLLQVPVASSAVFVSGSTGADGPFAPTANTVLQIPENGVFNFTTVNIPSSVTVTFAKNAANTPVTILVSGDVTIAGTINLDGSAGSLSLPGSGGPGGFDGGRGGSPGRNGENGRGPGGGGGGTTNSYDGGGGSGGGAGFAYNGTNGGQGNYLPGGGGGSAYGNDRLLPLIGGSGGGGGGGGSNCVGGGGGGGGGALLIASSGTINVTGTFTANGAAAGNGDGYGSIGGGGSGGSIRLVANTIAGNGTIRADKISTSFPGSTGRIRLECTTMTRTNATTPAFSSGTPSAFVPANMPTLVIASVAGIPVPGISSGSVSTPDIILPAGTNSTVTVVVSGTNIPAGSTVTVKATPSIGSAKTASATLDASLNASIPVAISTTYPSVITATITYQLTAANGGPMYVGGERIDKIRVATNLGGASTVTYLTESGREIPAAI